MILEETRVDLYRRAPGYVTKVILTFDRSVAYWRAVSRTSGSDLQKLLAGPTKQQGGSVKRILLVAVTLLLWVCCILPGAPTSAAAGPPQNPAQGKSDMTATAADLENAARDAASNDPSSIETLAHAVMTYPHVYRLPPELAEMLETELARSEIAYRNGTGKSVKEEEVLKLLNDISAKFHMPGYCRTTPVQVRNLRMKLAINLPSFMGRGLADRQSATRGQVEDTMSPLQAMHLFAVMVDQKVLNPLYQDPSLDLVRAEEEQRKAVEKARLTRGIRTKAFLMQSVNPHGLEVRQAMSKGAESMTVSDAFKLASEALKTLGLN